MVLACKRAGASVTFGSPGPRLDRKPSTVRVAVGAEVATAEAAWPRPAMVPTSRRSTTAAAAAGPRGGQAGGGAQREPRRVGPANCTRDEGGARGSVARCGPCARSAGGESGRGRQRDGGLGDADADRRDSQRGGCGQRDGGVRVRSAGGGEGGRSDQGHRRLRLADTGRCQRRDSSQGHSRRRGPDTPGGQGGAGGQGDSTGDEA